MVALRRNRFLQHHKHRERRFLFPAHKVPGPGGRPKERSINFHDTLSYQLAQQSAQRPPKTTVTPNLTFLSSATCTTMPPHPTICTAGILPPSVHPSPPPPNQILPTARDETATRHNGYVCLFSSRFVSPRSVRRRSRPRRQEIHHHQLCTLGRDLCTRQTEYLFLYKTSFILNQPV